MPFIGPPPSAGAGAASNGMIAAPWAVPEAAEQRDEADEGRVDAERGMVGANRHGVVATKDHGAVVRPSQLIASVRPTQKIRSVE